MKIMVLLQIIADFSKKLEGNASENDLSLTWPSRLTFSTDFCQIQKVNVVMVPIIRHFSPSSLESQLAQARHVSNMKRT